MNCIMSIKFYTGTHIRSENQKELSSTGLIKKLLLINLYSSFSEGFNYVMRC